jgi:hypothetical protein
MKMKRITNIAAAILLVLGFAACSNDDSSGNVNEGTARLSVEMVDAPGDYDSVFVDVEDVVIKYAGSEEEVSIGDINVGVYNLLELTGGLGVILVDDEIPVGTISQLRLVLGSNNSIVVDGQSYPLATPSAQQSGLKIQLNETLETGISYAYILDFDVEESIVVQGNGNYTLKPVIRASAEAETGSIRGAVLPIGFQTLVTASNGVVEVSSYVNAAGDFVLSGVPEGTYTVTIEAEPAAGLSAVVIQDVNVTIGEVTAMGTIDLEL